MTYPCPILYTVFSLVTLVYSRAFIKLVWGAFYHM